MIKKLTFFQKNILLAAIFTLMVGITLTASSFYSEGKVIRDTLTQQGVGLTNLLASQFDLEQIKQGAKQPDTNSDVQKKLIQVLDNMSTNNSNIAQGYLFQPDLTATGKGIFIATPTPVIELGLKPGTEYEPPQEFSDAFLKAKETKKPVASEIYTDDLGSWFSVLTPILGSNGEVVALFGIDMSANIIQESQWSMVKWQSLALVILFVLVTLIQYLNLKRMLAPIKALSHAVHEVGTGNMNIELKVNSHDEVGVVASGFNGMVKKIRNNMADLELAGKQMVLTFDQVASVSDTTNEQAKNVLLSLEEITASTEHLAYEAEKGNHQLLEINTQIEGILDYTSEASSSINNCLNQSDSGILVIEALKNNSDKTEQITLKVGEKIYGLEGRMRRINDLLTSIQDVAEQTSLLSLNASIEAARAGEHGRGFSVVAEEIRKLSTNSKQASEEIGTLLNAISQDVGATGHDMRIAETYLREQGTHVENTIHSFYQIRNHIETVVESIQKVNETVQTVERGKESLLTTVESVSSMSEQTAASVEMIKHNFTEQLQTIHTLNESCQAMQETANTLTDHVRSKK